MNIKLVDISEIEELKFLKKDFFIENHLELVKSIKKNNLIYPLRAVKKERKIFIIDGIKRYYIAQKLNISKIPVIIENYSSEKLLFINHLKYNIFRKFNNLEISNFVHSATYYFNCPLTLRYILLLSFNKFSEKLIQNYLNLNNLILDGKKMLSANILNIQTAFNLSKLDSKSQNLFIKLILNLRLNSNKQKKVFEKLFDISKRRDKNFYEVLLDFSDFLKEEYSKSLENNFFEKLEKIHSPDFYNFFKEFTNQKKEITKNLKGVNIYSPTNFEDDILTAEIFFKDFKELKEKITKFNKNLDEFIHQ